MSIKLLFLGCLITLSTSLWATDTGEFRGETKAKIEILQKQNDQINTKIDSLEKDVRDEYKTVTDRQNERIGDIASYFNTFLAVLGILAALAGYMTFKRSKELALNEVKDWLEKNGDSIKTEMAKFKQELAHMQKQAQEATKEHNKLLKDNIDNLEQETNEIRKKITAHHSEKNSISATGEDFRSKALNQYTFEDWDNRAYAADEEGKKIDAIYYWNQALEYGNPSDVQYLETCINIAVTHAELEHYKEEIEIYNKLIDKFINNQDEQIEEQIAFALYNKGLTYQILSDDENALEAYAILIKQFLDKENETINNDVAQALINTGLIFGKQKENHAAIQAYDTLLTRFNGTQNEKLNELIATALFNKAYRLGQEKENQKAIDTYNQIIQQFTGSSNKKIQEQVVKALINKAIKLKKKQLYNEAIECLIEAIRLNSNKLSAYINLFEIQIINGNNFDENLNKQFLEKSQNNSQYLLKYEALHIIKQSLHQNQTQKIDELKERYQDINFEKWNWNALESWAKKIKNVYTKNQVLATIEKFKNW